MIVNNDAAMQKTRERDNRTTKTAIANLFLLLNTVGMTGGVSCANDLDVAYNHHCQRMQSSRSHTRPNTAYQVLDCLASL